MRAAVLLVLKLSEHSTYQAVVSARIMPADQELASDDLLVAWLLTHVDHMTILMAERMADVIIRGRP
jgi:hypothetical protein